MTRIVPEWLAPTSLGEALELRARLGDEATVVAGSPQGEREIPIEQLITGYYETSLHPDELLVEVRIPRNVKRAVYRKFRSRSSEDRPCVAVAAAHNGAQ